MAPASSLMRSSISRPQRPGREGSPFLWLIRPRGGGSASSLPSAHSGWPGRRPRPCIPGRHPPAPPAAPARAEPFPCCAQSSVWGSQMGTQSLAFGTRFQLEQKALGAEGGGVGGGERWGFGENSCCPAVAVGGGAAGLPAELGFSGLTRGGGGEWGGRGAVLLWPRLPLPLPLTRRCQCGTCRSRGLGCGPSPPWASPRPPPSHGCLSLPPACPSAALSQLSSPPPRTRRPTETPTEPAGA